MVTFFPKLLRQSTIHKRGKQFVSEIANYILCLAHDGHIKIEKETITTYLKYVKIDMKNINKNYLKDVHLFNCIMKQHMPLETAIQYCYPNKKGKELIELFKFYTERDRIVWDELHYLPNEIIRIIIHKIS